MHLYPSFLFFCFAVTFPEAGDRSPYQISQLGCTPSNSPSSVTGATLATEVWPLHPSPEFRAGPGSPPSHVLRTQLQSKATK